MFLSVVWDVDPTMFSIGSFEVRWYGLGWALTFAIGMWMFIRFIKREGYPGKVFDSIFWWGVLSTIIGARLGHCLFYDPEYYLSKPWTIITEFRNGGLASHGAALGLLFGLWMFSRRQKIPYIWGLDRIMLPVTIGGAIVRLGNLMNSEIYGGPTTMPWGFEFVQDPRWSMPLEAGGSGALPVHPTQLYEALCYLLTFGVLMWLYYGRDYGRRRPGVMFGVGLIGVFLSRFLIEFIKNPQVEREMDWFLDMGQILSIPFIILGFWILIRALRKPPVTVNGPVYTTTPKISKAIDEQTAKKTAERSAAAKEAAKANIKSASETKQEQPANNEPGNQQKK